MLRLEGAAPSFVPRPVDTLPDFDLDPGYFVIVPPESTWLHIDRTCLGDFSGFVLFVFVLFCSARRDNITFHLQSQFQQLRAPELTVNENLLVLP
mmetsp:Transcript_56409/g.136881  ORF Transcript_56409/g.136881 Transcript_56409/m.136881 type:complete len:95 (-) Transcript_56409:88-372(-)